MRRARKAAAKSIVKAPDVKKDVKSASAWLSEYSTVWEPHKYDPEKDYTPPTRRIPIDLPPVAITLDMDGSLEDPWACCGGVDFYGGTEKCRHFRQDTIDRARAIQAKHKGCEFVIVSWRHDLSDVIRGWLDIVGVEVARIFTDGSPDTILLGHKYSYHQVPFKMGIVRELQARGVKVVASFDDNKSVVEAYADLVPEACLVPHLYDEDDPKNKLVSGLPAMPKHAKQYKAWTPLPASHWTASKWKPGSVWNSEKKRYEHPDDKDRRCADPECDTELSEFNVSGYCYKHGSIKIAGSGHQLDNEAARRFRDIRASKKQKTDAELEAEEDFWAAVEAREKELTADLDDEDETAVDRLLSDLHENPYGSVWDVPAGEDVDI